MEACGRVDAQAEGDGRNSGTRGTDEGKPRRPQCPPSYQLSSCPGAISKVSECLSVCVCVCTCVST